MKRRYLGPVTYMLCAMLLLSGCSVMGLAKGLFASGVSLQTVGTQFVAVSEQVTAGCAARAIPAPTCERYRVFGEQFKRTYPVTVGLWNAARTAGDKATQARAEDVAAQLAEDLSKLAVEALRTFTEER